MAIYTKKELQEAVNGLEDNETICAIILTTHDVHDFYVGSSSPVDDVEEAKEILHEWDDTLQNDVWNLF